MSDRNKIIECLEKIKDALDEYRSASIRRDNADAELAQAEKRLLSAELEHRQALSELTKAQGGAQ